MSLERANRIEGLLARLWGQPKFLTYQQAQELTLELAAGMREAFGYHNLSNFKYVAIPRGGYIVLGMLSYALNLPTNALQPLASSDSTLVIVDDCSLSGARFRQFLQEVKSKEVIFVHLLSNSSLREAILKQEPAVSACLAAADLFDLAPEIYSDRREYLAWNNRWQQRLGSAPYWIGIPELVIFPWSEPDRLVWNSATKQTENIWRLAAPDRCLKNWAQLGVPPRARVRLTLRVPDHVAYALGEEEITLCNLNTEELFGLQGTAAIMWRALAAYSDHQATLAYLLEIYDVEEATLEADLNAFVQTLLAQNLLEQVDPVNGTTSRPWTERGAI